MLVHLRLRRASLLNSSSKSAQHSTAPRTEEVCLQLPASAHNVALLAFAARRRLASRVAIDRCILNF